MSIILTEIRQCGGIFVRRPNCDLQQERKLSNDLRGLLADGNEQKIKFFIVFHFSLYLACFHGTVSQTLSTGEGIMTKDAKANRE